MAPISRPSILLAASSSAGARLLRSVAASAEDPCHAAPPGDQYALVLESVDDYFGGLICKFAAPGPPQDAQLNSAVGVSTLFIEAYGVRSGAARRRLNASLSTTGAVRLALK